ncbi:MAG TPA: bifunctional phosphoribosylaminoimidazolecarboxamide formyltransferase/IMP cyclohydrolase [Vicinamibacterales bacterium]|nr:bifunctional phosphoribosylaminoimidazolecarboxamide formyltransferase/IMP cyclohydrolase [Vicinamibacterales bacterium]
MPRALISVSDKTAVVELARGLAARGYELVSTGGTAATLTAAGLTVLNVADVTGFPEMMDGRIKTLHPRVHGGILARRSFPDHLEAAARHGITLIDVVVVNLYPFAEAAGNPATPFEAVIEEIDIGGPALVRAAAKNFQDVLVVVSPSDYAAVLGEIDRTGGPSAAFRLELARKAFAHTAAYDTAIAATLAATSVGDTGYVRGGEAVHSPTLSLTLRKVCDLRYGENPHQTAAWYADGVAAFGGAQLLQGKELSYTNLLDLDAAMRIVLEFDEPAAAVIKHTNPCGAATGSSTADAYVKAREADRLSSFGGIVAINRPIDPDTARAIVSTRIDAVVAPVVSPEALPILAAKAQMRVVVASFDAGRVGDFELRSILGGLLAQRRDRVGEAGGPWPGGDVRVVTRRKPTAEEWQALRFAWRICAHVKSNAVIFTTADRTLAIGAGQMSRVDAVNVARMKAAGAEGPSLRGAVAASDAYFPFRDGLDAVAAAGATAVVQPGGSVKDAEVIAAAEEHGLAMVFTGRRHFRH